MTIKVTYSEMLDLRRKICNRDTIAPVLYSSKVGSEYILTMQDNNFSLETVVTGTDITDFEANRLQYCNKLFIPDIVEKVTHDFADNTMWLYGTSNSFYPVFPDSGKLLRVKRFLVKFDKGATLTQDVKMCLWQTVDGTAVPAMTNNSATVYGVAPFFNPPTTYTGWYKYYPPVNDPQEVEVWLYMNNGTAQYKVSAFTYSTLEEIRLKAEDKIVGNYIIAEYNYKNMGISMSLCSSLNERIEIYLSNDTQITAPNSVKCVCSVMLDSLDEW